MTSDSKRNTSHIATRISPGDRVAIDKAAAACGIPTATWLRIVALSAAGVSPLEEQLTRSRAKGKGAGGDQ